MSSAYLRDKLHLGEPLPVRYAYWLGGVLQGDLGESMRMQKPVTALIAQKLPVTLELATLAIVIALAIGIPAGIVSAVAKGTAWDYAANAVALWGLSTPNFWLGIMMILLFSVSLGWLPASGYVSPFEDLRGNLAAMIMPAFVLGNAIAAVLMRHTRSAMLQVLSSDYVRTARAKGLTEHVVILKHALRKCADADHHAGRARARYAAVRRGAHRAGVSIPGFGKLIVDAVFNRDYAVVQGVVLFTATAYIVLNLLADIAYFMVNPRVCAADGNARPRWRTAGAKSRPPCVCATRQAAGRNGGPHHRPFFSWRSQCSPRSSRRTIRCRRAGPRSQGAVRRALVRHRRDRPRCVVARDLRHAGVAARRAGIGVHRVVVRRADRPARGLRRPLAGRADLADD